MRSTLILFLIIGYGSIGHAQDIVTAQKQIKVGNSLREAQQYDNSEEYLLKGLANAQKLNNKYWEAVADEYLGLLYRDLKEESTSMRYLNNAYRIYNSIGMGLSAKVVKDMLNGNTEQGADLFGGIEIGSKGIKYSIVKVWRVNGTLTFRAIRNGTRDVGPANLTDNAIHDAAIAVRDYMDTIEHFSIPIPNERIFVAVSSGVKQEMDKRPGSEEKMRAALAEAVPGKPIGVLTPGAEARLTIKGIVPGSYLLRSTTMDIGSGNTKGGYFFNKTDFDSLSIPWGSATLARKITGKSDQLAYARQFFRDSILNDPAVSLDAELQRRSAFLDRKYAFFSGGIVWVLVTYLYPGKCKEDVVEFTARDVDRFLRLAGANMDSLRNPDLSQISDEAVAQEARNQVQQTMQFNNSQLIAGAVILKGFMDEMDKSTPRKNYYFLRNGVTGWITGYIVNQIADSYRTAKAD